MLLETLKVGTSRLVETNNGHCLNMSPRLPGSGRMAQKERQDQSVEDAVKEMAKPLARYENDRDLDAFLKEQERDGDPMLAMLRKKKTKERELAGIKEKPKYRGPAPQPNRFKIPPGYRWDGVNRSNGFEKKYFARTANNKAMQEVKYKWSVEDM